MAVRVLVPVAFLGTGLADLGAERKDALGKVAAAAERRGGKTAHVGALSAGADAARHHGDVLLAQVGVEAIVAGVGAGVQNAEDIELRLVHWV